MTQGIKHLESVFVRVERLENLISEEQIRCQEIANEAEREFNFDRYDQKLDRYKDLCIRLERVQEISAHMWAERNLP